MDGWLGRWFRWVTAGELAGFCAPALAGPLLVAADPWAGAAVLVLAGLVEGTVLGAAQAAVLTRALPGFSRRRWVTLTALGAGAAYVLGVLPSATYRTWQAWPGPAAAAVGVVLAGALLLSIGSAQWVELRRHVDGAAWWLLGSAASWLVGLGAFFAIASPLWHEGQALPLAVAVGLLAAAAMAATMALVTGLVLRHLLATRLAGSAGRVSVRA